MSAQQSDDRFVRLLYDFDGLYTFQLGAPATVCQCGPVHLLVTPGLTLVNYGSHIFELTFYLLVRESGSHLMVRISSVRRFVVPVPSSHFIPTRQKDIHIGLIGAGTTSPRMVVVRKYNMRYFVA